MPDGRLARSDALARPRSTTRARRPAADGRPAPGGRLSRRQVLRRTIRGATAAVAAGTAAALVPGPGPAVAAPVTVVFFQISWQLAWDATAVALCQEFVDRGFNARHRGVRAVPQPWGNASGVLAQALAGDSTMPAVVASCCADFPVALPMLADLTPLLRSAGLSPTQWSSGQVASLTSEGRLHAVPAYTACQPLIYNRSLLRRLKIAAPDPGWDHNEAAALWRRLAGNNAAGQRRYGATIEWQPNGFDALPFMFRGWGGALMNTARTRCLMDSPADVACGQWVYPLVWDQICINRWGIGGMDGAQALASDRVAMFQDGGTMLYSAVMQIPPHIDWDIVPMPAWPRRRTTAVQLDYYGLNAAYPHADLAWELFRFIAASPEANRFMARTTLGFPGLLSMWPEWERIVRAAAPVTANKQIGWWADAATKGYGIGQQFWKYEDQQTADLLGNALQAVWDRQIDVAPAFRAIAREVTAFQGLAWRDTASQLRLQKLLRRYTAAGAPAPATVPAPPRNGFGVAATPAPRLVHARGTTATLRGAGAGINGTSDNCTFAGVAWTQTSGTFACRITRIEDPSHRGLADGAKVGLMARGDLADGAASVDLVVAAGRGVHFQARPYAGLTLGDTRPGSDSQAAGLIGPEVILRRAPDPSGNYLLRPVWLRLVLDDERWIGYSSIDGSHFTPVAPPVTIDAVGVWIGLCVTAHSAGHYAAAAFDHIEGFRPDVFVQVGVP